MRLRFIYLVQLSLTTVLFNNGVKALDTLVSEFADISLVDFQGLLYSEVNSEIESVLYQNDRPDDGSIDETEKHKDPRLRGRYLMDQDVSSKVQDVWDSVIQHGWDMAYSLNDHFPHMNRSLQKESLHELMTAPYLICSHSSKRSSGFQRLQTLLDDVNVHLGDSIVVRNDPNRTCYHVSLKIEDALEVRKSSRFNSDGDYYSILPMTDVMKIQFDTMNLISNESWVVPSVQSDDDWERILRVGLSAGQRFDLDQDDTVIEVAKRIIEDVRSKARSGAPSRRERRLQAKETMAKDTVSSVSIVDLFSLTSSNTKQSSKARGLRRSDKNIQGMYWSRALELGLEADHSCEAMFQNLELNAHFDNQGFDIVLNPIIKKKNDQDDEENNGIELEEKNDGIELEEKKNDGIETQDITCEDPAQCIKGIESSATNKHCVSSLVIALSTHPSVLSIESEGPILENDYEAQWITQSKQVGERPLRDIGVDGSNQIISIVDSGLDINHKYFGPTDATVFNGWDYSQRKVVRYDSSIGDKVELKGGHGTKVAGVAAGLFQADSEGNGVAEGAKLHILDIKQGSGAYMMPSAYSFFESMHDTNQTPARIANGSFSTAYRAYPFSCKFYDDALYGQYQGDLYVASAGNDGLDDSLLQSKERTIGNPASCKNVLAVGASQSYGDRLTSGDKGVDYLAAFSSRGPTYDGRMKPDLVAPGSSVLTAYAQESGTVQDYGTSVSGPVVAGNAALVRQYFEDGKLPCKRNCSLDPSGSLVKAVLMNSAYSLKQVQVSSPWLEKRLLEQVNEYDSNQGMGLIQLDKTLPIPDHNKFTAIVRNNEVIQDQDYHDIYVRANPGACRNTSYKRDFSATLAWYDPSGASSCAKCLLDDLDISVHLVKNNGKVKNASVKYPNGGSRKDYDNNVERIRFKMKGRKLYRIRIHASNLSTANTKYSMIASGCFKEITIPPWQR